MKDYSLCDDNKLTTEIQAGNMLAFDTLYKRYSNRLFKFAFSILKSKEEAENILQDVFLKLWINRGTIEKGSSIRYYIFTTAYNTSISAIRKKITESRFIEYVKDLQDVIQEPADLQVEYNELFQKLNEAVDSLPARQKEVYLLHNIDGLKYSEIAERLHISKNTIECHMSRALRTIRDKMGKFSLLAALFFYLFA